MSIAKHSLVPKTYPHAPDEKKFPHAPLRPLYKRIGQRRRPDASPEINGNLNIINFSYYGNKDPFDGKYTVPRREFFGNTFPRSFMGEAQGTAKICQKRAKEKPCGHFCQ